MLLYFGQQLPCCRELGVELERFFENRASLVVALLLDKGNGQVRPDQEERRADSKSPGPETDGFVVIASLHRVGSERGRRARVARIHAEKPLVQADGLGILRSQPV